MVREAIEKSEEAGAEESVGAGSAVESGIWRFAISSAILAFQASMSVTLWYAHAGTAVPDGIGLGYLVIIVLQPKSERDSVLFEAQALLCNKRSRAIGFPSAPTVRRPSVADTLMQS